MSRRKSLTPCAYGPVPCPVLTRNTYCPRHQPRRARTSERGYGSTHQRVRQHLEVLYPDGPCGRCGEAGSWTDRDDPLTAGHVDHRGPQVLENYEPQHRSCNNREMLERRRAGADGGRGAPRRP